MKLRLAEINSDTEDLLPPTTPDGSRIGVNYADAVLKTLNVQLDDGRKVVARRKGLRIILEVGDRKGEALMRRLEHGPEPRAIFRQALAEAAAAIGARLVEEERTIYFEM